MKIYNVTMELEMRHLQLVRAVAATGTLTRAGVALHLTQSALSHQLRDIESRLGTALFLRVGKRLTLTPAGDRLLASANDVLTTIQQTEDAIRQLAGDSRGVLRITTECYTCYHWLPPILKRYHRAHPRVDVRIDVTATNDPITALLEGRLDLAVVSDAVRDRRVVTRPLFEDEMVVVMAPGHRLADRKFIEAGDFAAETLLSYSPKEESTVCQRLLIPSGVAPAHLLQMQLTEAIIEMAKAGLGIGVLAWWAVEPDVRAGRLKAVPLTRKGYGRVWNAATLKDLARVPYVRAFIDLLAEHPPFAVRRNERARKPRKTTFPNRMSKVG
jgi:LysR family transcriptional regulator for metE and metH